MDAKSRPLVASSRDSNLHLAYLCAELGRIDVLISREVLRWRLAGQDPSSAFRGLSVSDTEADALLARPLATNWGHTVALSPSQAQAFAVAQKQAVHQVHLRAEALHQRDQVSSMEHLTAVFGLDAFDIDALLVCLAPALDLRYQRIFGFLQDDVTQKHPTVNLILDLLCEPGIERMRMLSHFADDAPLMKHSLINWAQGSDAGGSPLLNQILNVDNSVVAWLLGTYRPHPELGGHAHLSWPQENEMDSLLAAEAWPRVRQALTQDNPLVVFHGQDQGSQQATARLLGAHLGRPILSLNLALCLTAERPAVRVLRLALRDARLSGAIPYLTGWDACLLPDGSTPTELLGELYAYPGMVILSSRPPWQPAGADRDRPLITVEYPVPSFGQRRSLWQRYLSRALPNEDISQHDLSALAGQFLLTAAQIREAVASAKDTSTLQGKALQDDDLFAAARLHSSPGLGGLARKITPRYQWDDIVLPPDQMSLLREIVGAVRGRPVVLEEWGVARKLTSSSGITVLFAGPPGTGKTMAAEVIAGELGLDLYKIDLSTIVSKYIGETEKNLERIFTEAQNSNAILFFDEADAIFGKRSEVKDAHDRYANIEVSYLLQRMEAYDGVTILATNLRANLDEAFTRRLQFAIDIPFPDEEYRLRIWQTLFPPEVPRDPDLDLEFMARRFKLAGGSIRNILVSAAYLAAMNGGRVTMQQMLHGTRRELQKMGRLVNEKDMAV